MKQFRFYFSITTSQCMIPPPMYAIVVKSKWLDGQIFRARQQAGNISELSQLAKLILRSQKQRDEICACVQSVSSEQRTLLHCLPSLATAGYEELIARVYRGNWSRQNKEGKLRLCIFFRTLSQKFGVINRPMLPCQCSNYASLLLRDASLCRYVMGKFQRRSRNSITKLVYHPIFNVLYGLHLDKVFAQYSWHGLGHESMRSLYLPTGF